MYSLIIITLCFIIFLILICQKITVDFLVSEKSEVIIDYSFFSLSIKQTGKGKNSNINGVKIIIDIIKSLKRSFRHFTLSLNKIVLPKKETHPSLSYGAVSAIIAPFAVLTDAKIDKLQIITAQNNISPALEFSIECRLYIFIYTLLCFLFETIKRRIGRNGRKQGK